jgi:hypothetical protein
VPEHSNPLWQPHGGALSVQVPMPGEPFELQMLWSKSALHV